MKDLDPFLTEIKGLPQRVRLIEELEQVHDQCIECPKCLAECAFLRQYGTPGTIAGAYNPSDSLWLTAAFECSLCGLCTAVCPVGLDPKKMFLEMRREAVDRDAAPFFEHQTITAYEKRGTSKRFSWYSLPENCHTVLFPGCTLTGTRPDTMLKLFKHLKKIDPAMGIVLDCCCKPSHDLGRQKFFDDMLNEMKSFLIKHGVKKIITACPNCYNVFKQNGNPLEVTTAYQVMASSDLTEIFQNQDLPTVSIHDPCVLRQDNSVHQAVRQLAGTRGFTISEMPHSQKTTLCCGEGGSVGFVSKKYSDNWREMRKSEAQDSSLLAYCAGCAGSLNKHMPTVHILDALFNPDALPGAAYKVSKAPWTYLNRLRVKRYLKKNHPDSVTRERNFYAETGKQNHSIRFVMLFCIVTLIAGIHFFDVTRFLDPETLQQAVVSWGILAPMVYMLIYAIAPALFLPGLPITIAGGVLFGPFWGVIYSITGATIGASIAFLIARYIAGDQIRNKLRNPRWQRLDMDVEKHGWKIVAFTRLVPLFPFNLLNYAFGLTSIKFSHYALTSFICMLPACIAFIVFSSSFLDIIKGNISSEFITGIVLIAIVSFIPVMARKFFNRVHN